MLFPSLDDGVVRYMCLKDVQLFFKLQKTGMYIIYVLLINEENPLKQYSILKKKILIIFKVYRWIGGLDQDARLADLAGDDRR